jgi:hypothetical protein
MMWEAQPPQGSIRWLSDLEDPLIGSPIVAVRIREAAETGIQATWPAALVFIDIKKAGDVRFALEMLYGADVQFSDDAPEPTEFVEPVEPGLIY